MQENPQTTVTPPIPATADPTEPPVAAVASPAAAGDTDLGWRIGGWCLIASAVIQLLSLVMTVAGAPDPNAPAVYGSRGMAAPASTASVNPAQAVGNVVGAGVAIALAVGLLTNKPWARMAVIGFIAFAACVIVLAAFLVNARDLPLGSRASVFVIAAWMFAGWYVLLDRPTNPRKVAVGAAMVGVLILIGVVRLAMANTVS